MDAKRMIDLQIENDSEISTIIMIKLILELYPLPGGCVPHTVYEDRWLAIIKLLLSQ